MKCDLCYKDKRQAVRVNTWTVCHDCSASGILRSAIAAQENVTQLRVLLAAAQLRLEEDIRIQLEAMNRIKRAQEELDASIDALIPLIAKSSDSRLGSRQASENVVEFEASHPYVVDEQPEIQVRANPNNDVRISRHDLTASNSDARSR
jgi:hypothetical protein